MYIPNSTIYGSVKDYKDFEWSNDFTASRDNQNKWTGSETFTCRLADAPLLVPINGTSCRLAGWTWMISSGCEINNISGDLCEIKVNYGGFQDSDDGDDDDEDLEKFTYKLGLSLNEEPLYTNYRYKDVIANDKKIARDLINGKIEQVVGSTYDFQNTSDETKAKKYTVTSDLGKELIDNIRKGFTVYKAPATVWNASYKTKKKPKAKYLNQVGFISTALNAPALANGRNWLFIGMDVDQDVDKIYTINYQWQASGLGGWDTAIYTKPA